jgi:hypothetical protein
MLLFDAMYCRRKCHISAQKKFFKLPLFSIGKRSDESEAGHESDEDGPHREDDDGLALKKSEYFIALYRGDRKKIKKIVDDGLSLMTRDRHGWCALLLL